MHQNIQKAYSYLAERDQRSREKPLAAYYRVSFFGKLFAAENNKVYIYKEPSNTKLFEICERLRKIYNARFLAYNQMVEILNDSRKVKTRSLSNFSFFFKICIYYYILFSPANSNSTPRTKTTSR